MSAFNVVIMVLAGGDVVAAYKFREQPDGLQCESKVTTTPKTSVAVPGLLLMAASVTVAKRSYKQAIETAIQFINDDLARQEADRLFDDDPAASLFGADDDDSTSVPD